MKLDTFGPNLSHQQSDKPQGTVFSCHSESLYWTIPQFMFQEAGFHLDMDLHGKTWRGLRKVASRSIQVFIQVKEKLSNIHITLLRFL